MAMDSPRALFLDDLSGQCMVFTKPYDLIVARTAGEIPGALARLEEARIAGHWLAGYLSYEAGFAFEEKLKPLVQDHRETPLVCFGVFGAPEGNDHPLARSSGDFGGEPFLTDVRPGWDFHDYRKRFDRLHDHLRRGDCYQANLTMPITATWHGDARSAFWPLIERQPVRYGALLELGGPIILSRSPELFFTVDTDGMIETHPMKGTAARGASAEEDMAIIAAMREDEKTQVENRMIVDLLRNDISRIAEVGSVSVPRLFDIETYPTVHQMVSHVRARLLPDVSVTDIFAALFPCGSITGAPKLRAMQILHELETGPRDAYCGAIGWIDPKGPMRFSVAIRTLTLFSQSRAVFNVGGGIVFDSKAEAEYQECLLKARFAVDSDAIHAD